MRIILTFFSLMDISFKIPQHRGGELTAFTSCIPSTATKSYMSSGLVFLPLKINFVVPGGQVTEPFFHTMRSSTGSGTVVKGQVWTLLQHAYKSTPGLLVKYLN